MFLFEDTITPPDDYVEPGLFVDAPASEDDYVPFEGSDLEGAAPEEQEEA